MKKITSILLASLLILSQFPILTMAQETGNPTDIIVKKVYTPRRIQLEDYFTLEIELEIKNNNISKEDVFITLKESNSFILDGSGSTKSINKNNIASFRLKYVGGSSGQIPISINYSIKENNYSISDYVSIPDVEGQVDGSKISPDVSIVSNKTLPGEAGTTVSFPITIRNISNSTAKDISVSADVSESEFILIDGSGHQDFSRLRDKKEEDFRFKFSIDKNAEEKTYPIKVNFKYFNEHGTSFTSSETIYIRVSNKSSDMQIMAEMVEILPNPNNVEPGSDIYVGFSLSNIGPSDVKDIKLSINGLENDKVSLSTGLNKKNVPLIKKGNTEYIYFPLKVSNKIKAGNHELGLKLVYKNSKNVIREDEALFYIPVKGTSSQGSSLIIENISYPTGGIAPNKNVELSFNIRNRGQNDARDIIVRAESSDTTGVVPRSVTTIKIDKLAPGETRQVRYSFLTVKDAETKNYPINIKVEYKDDFIKDDEPHSLDQFVGIFVDNPKDDGKKSTPKLIIDKYSFQPQLVEAGKNFEMSLSFYNTNKSKSVENIKIFLTAEPSQGTNPDSPTTGSSVFTPVDSSNTFYIDSIKPKGRVEKNITMFTIPDAVAKTHVITANFEYEDSQGEAYTATELIGVPVVQQSRLDIGELNYQSEASLGEYVPVSVEFYNTGKVPLYNMMVKLEGNFQTENGSSYIGNFANGSSEFFEGSVIPSEEGLLEGEIVFSYEDSTGEEIEIREPFSINITEAFDEFPDDFPMEEEGPTGLKKILMSKWLWAIVALLLAGFGFKKYKEKKADQDILEEDIDSILDDNKDNDLDE